MSVPDPAPAPHAVLVGGGAAGTLLSLALRRQAPHWRVTVLDRAGAFGRGLAYAATAAVHRLNVPAERMGGLASGDREGFLHWLAATGEAPGSHAAAFTPRQRYGDYLCQALEAAQAAAPGWLQLQAAEVHALRRQGPAWQVHTSAGVLRAEAAVLCTGHPPPARLPGGGQGPGWVDDVWAAGALDGVGADQAVLVVGSGATAIDTVLALWARGHRGPLTLLSRHGLLPRADPEPAAPWPAFIAPGEALTLRAALRRWRAETHRAARDGQPWQAVFDAGRAAVPALWSGFSRTDKARALRHLRPWWMVHRHRLAPDVAQTLAEAQAQGRLAVVAARFSGAQRQGTQWVVQAQRRGGGPQSWTVDQVLNCTGPSERCGDRDEALWRQLRAEGLVQPGELGLGLAVDGARRVLDAKGQVQPGLHALGLPCRGRDWEVTSIPFLREQAEALAAELARGWPATANAAAAAAAPAAPANVRG